MQLIGMNSQGLKYEFKMLLPAESIAARTEARLVELSRTLHLPGFRPGKVPMTLVRKRYRETVRAEIIAISMQETTSWLLEKHNLEPALKPRVCIISGGQEKEGGGLEDIAFTVAVEAMPEIPVIDLTTLHVEKFRAEISDRDIDKALVRLSIARRTIQSIGDNRPAKLGDIAVVDVSGSMVTADQYTADISKTDFSVELKANEFIPGFAEAIIGARTGDVLTFQLSIPENRSIATSISLPHRISHIMPADTTETAVISLTVFLKDIKTVVDTPTGDVLAQICGVENLNALRRDIRMKLEQECALQSRMRVRRAVLKKIISIYQFEVPSGVIEAEAELLQKQVAAASTRSDSTTKDEDTLKAQCWSVAEERVRLGLLLTKVGRQHDISLTKEDFDQALVREAQSLSIPPKSVLRQYCQTTETLSSWKATLLERKIVDFIMKTISSTECMVTVDELFTSSNSSIVGSSREST